MSLDLRYPSLLRISRVRFRGGLRLGAEGEPPHPCGEVLLRDPGFEDSTDLERSTFDPPYPAAEFPEGHNAGWYDHPWTSAPVHTVTGDNDHTVELSSANPRSGTRHLRARVVLHGRCVAWANGNFADVAPGDMADSVRPMAVPVTPGRRVETSGWVSRVQGEDFLSFEWSLIFLRADGSLISTLTTTVNPLSVGPYQQVGRTTNSAPNDSAYACLRVTMINQPSTSQEQPHIVDLDDCVVRVCNPL